MTHDPFSPADMTPTPQAASLLDQLKLGLQDVWLILRTLAANPVGQLAAVNQLLPANRLRNASLALGALISLAILFSVSQLLAAYFRAPIANHIGWFKLLLMAVMPFLALLLAGFVSRKLTKCQAGLAQDSLIAAISLLPLGLWTVIAALSGVANAEFVWFALLCAVCLTIVLLFAGLSRVYQMSESLALWLIPVLLLAVAWLNKIIDSAIIESALRSRFW